MTHVWPSRAILSPTSNISSVSQNCVSPVREQEKASGALTDVPFHSVKSRNELEGECAPLGLQQVPEVVGVRLDRDGSHAPIVRLDGQHNARATSPVRGQVP